jgi:hypothetical protein
MIVTVLVAMVLLVARFMAVCDKKMSCPLFFWLPFVFGNLLKNTGHFVGHLAMLEKNDELKRVRGHRLVCICELKLMHLGPRKEYFFALLLCCGHFHHSTEVATVKVVKELYLTPHELMHWHESGLFGSTKPADQLIANIGEPGDCLKVIPDALVQVCLCMVCVGGASLGDNACPFGQTYILKTLIW